MVMDMPMAVAITDEGITVKDEGLKQDRKERAHLADMDIMDKGRIEDRKNHNN